MAAGDEFPRGWDQPNAQAATGAAATCTIPAAAGIAHVLTNINALWVVSTNAAFAAQLLLNVSGGVVITEFGLLTIADGVGVAGVFSGKDTFSWTGKITFPINTAVTVAFGSVTAAGNVQVIEIQGYDI